MNKQCPVCNRAVFKNQPHVFHDGQRHHSKCLDKKLGFLKLWDMGMKFYTAGEKGWQFRWCEKTGKAVPFPAIKDLECWKCQRFIENNGNCDCI